MNQHPSHILYLPRRLMGAFLGTSLKARSARSASWTTTGFGLQYALRLISTLILTRLLTPEAFGLMSLAGVILTGLALISDIGTTPSIIRSKRGEDPTFLQTAWTLQVIRGALIAMGACLLAWPLAWLYDEPLLFPIVAALSLTALLQGLSSIAIPRARRQMELRRLTVLEVSSHAVTIVVTIIFAWQFRSVWALVAGGIVGGFVRVVLSHVMLSPFRHAFRLEREALSEIIIFGRWILLGTLLTFLGGKGITAIRGTLVPVDVLGLLTLAGTISWALGDLISKLLGSVAFPALSEVIRERPHDTARILRKIQLVLIGGALPCFLLLSFVATDLIGLMYDDRYAMAGVFLMLTSLGAAGGVLSMPYQNAMLAMGNSRTHAIVMFSSAVLKITGTVFGFHFGGAIWMIVLSGFTNGIILAASASFAYRRGIANLPLDATALTILGVAYAIVLTNTSTL